MVLLDAGEGHRLAYTAPFAWCQRCGGFTSMAAKHTILHSVCKWRPSGPGAELRLSKVAQGRHPMDGHDLGVLTVPLGVTGAKTGPAHRLAIARGHMGSSTVQARAPMHPASPLETNVAVERMKLAIEEARRALDGLSMTLTGFAAAWRVGTRPVQVQQVATLTPVQAAARAKARATCAERCVGVVLVQYGGSLY